MKKSRVILVVMLSLLLAFTLSTTVWGEVRGEIPYTGVIKNDTGMDITFCSKNSMATLIVPAHGWMEYVAWTPEFQMIGYVNGQPYYCENIRVAPNQVQFMCNNYDFMAEIAPAPAPPQKFRKGLKPGEVEGLG